MKKSANSSPAVTRFVDLLEVQIRSRKMVLAQLARTAGIGCPYLHRVLKREQTPSMAWAEKVGKHVGIKVRFEKVA